MTLKGKEGFTVGIGLTNRCNANCPHCYSRPENGYSDIEFDAIVKLVSTLPVRSVNFGTGESIFYSRFWELTERFYDAGIPMSLTSNGTTVSRAADNQLKRFHDIDFSLDFPDEVSNDHWRGEGYFRQVLESAERCRDLGIDTSLVLCMMNSNYHLMKPMLELARNLGMSLRINIYKAVNSDSFKLSYEEFWQGIRDLAADGTFVSCSEPIVNAAMNRNNGHRGHPCGNDSFRIKPDGNIVACVYLSDSGVNIGDMTADAEKNHDLLHKSIQLPLPGLCRECKLVEICGGGCASRRILGSPNEPDEFCFVKKGDNVDLNPRWAVSKGLIHEDYLCTMIFSA